ncbi:MAG: adenylate/guanylate cyclase domain-containing protein [Allorhizobium sp.]
MEIQARSPMAATSMPATELEAERTLAILRIFCGVCLAIPHIADLFIPATHHGIPIASILVLATLLMIGLLVLYLIRKGRFRPWMRYVFAVADAIMVASICFLSLSRNDLPGSSVFAVPAVWTVPLLLTVGALRYRPAIQIWSACLFILALVLVAVTVPSTQEVETTSHLQGLERLFSFPASVSRLMLLLLTAVASIIVIYRARVVLLVAEQEGYSRAALSRFLPSEIVPLVTEGDAWLEGHRQQVVILFVDIRNSTQISEDLDPKTLSELISAFRAMVQQAAHNHGGVIDKFIGDGAMVLFGVPSPGADDARRSLGCAREILELVALRGGGSTTHFSVGIGVHQGVVYCGIIGDERRREFTVIGDAVNVASRIEEMTKHCGTPLLASQEVVVSAGESDGWQPIHSEPLRGKQRSITLMAPKAANPG